MEFFIFSRTYADVHRRLCTVSFNIYKEYFKSHCELITGTFIEKTT